MLLELLASAGSLSPRELAELAGLDETEVSRRLRRLERLGLLEAEWSRGWSPRRLYRLRFSNLCFSPSKGLASAPPEPPAAAAPRPPAGFLGRSAELGVVTSSRGLLHLHGVPGSGKTALLAAAASSWRGKVVWLHGSRRTSGGVLRGLVRLHGGQEFLKEGGLLVLDDAQLAQESAVEEAARLGSATGAGLVVIATHVGSRIVRRYAPSASQFALRGLGRIESMLLLRRAGLEEELTRLIAERAAGLPGLLLAADGSRSPREALARVERAARLLWGVLSEELGEPGATMLSAIASAGVPVPWELLASACPSCRSPDHIADMLLEAGLLVEDSEGVVASPEAEALAIGTVPAPVAKRLAKRLGGLGGALLYASAGLPSKAAEELRSLGTWSGRGCRVAAARVLALAAQRAEPGDANVLREWASLLCEEASEGLGPPGAEGWAKNI